MFTQVEEFLNNMGYTEDYKISRPEDNPELRWFVSENGDRHFHFFEQEGMASVVFRYAQYETQWNQVKNSLRIKDNQI